MSVKLEARPIEYPASDGEPTLETPIQWQVTVDTAAALKRRYRGRDDVFVGRRRASAEAERGRAEAERAKAEAERLAARLRELGVDEP